MTTWITSHEAIRTIDMLIPSAAAKWIDDGDTPFTSEQRDELVDRMFAAANAFIEKTNPGVTALTHVPELHVPVGHGEVVIDDELMWEAISEAEESTYERIVEELEAK